MKLRINPASDWAKAGPIHRRASGFFTYLFAAFITLISPEMADTVMFKTLREQFIDE